MTLEQVRQLLLCQFQQWGLPRAIRTDNGVPLGVPDRSIIPVVSLWLAAWGIKHILNRPARPTDNPNVENNQGTSARWAEVYKCKDHIEMEKALDEVALFQRDFFKVSRIGHVTRKQLYPLLYNNPRKFDERLFDVQKAYQLLAQAILPRKVSSCGVIVIYDKPFSVERKNAGKIVLVTFDPVNRVWNCRDQQKNILKTIPDPRFCEQNILNLTICQ